MKPKWQDGHLFDKRYLVFSYEEFYPNGGLNDIKGCFDDLQEAKEFANEQTDIYDYTQIFDTETNSVVETFELNWEE